jgi:riboflavin synthase
LESAITEELKVDQSVAQWYLSYCCCINSYTVTAIDETVQKLISAIGPRNQVEPRRAMKLGDRLDGHIVQGHVDQVGTCIQASETNGSWSYTLNMMHL